MPLNLHSSASPVLPYANPAYRTRKEVDPEVKAAVAAFEKEFSPHHNEPVPPPQREDPVWSLEEVLGPERARAIEQSGVLVFHAVGDTGYNEFPINNHTGEIRWNQANAHDEQNERDVAGRLVQDVDVDQPAAGPAFLFHLGDVIYFDNTRKGYREQFYEPFASYPNKIIAISGNHDCEVKLSQQNYTLEAFQENFCQPGPTVPPAGRDTLPLRQMVSQPGVYWRLDAPFLQIIGLCSNVGEEGGSLRGSDEGQAQYAWFERTLAEVKADQDQRGSQRRGLIVAMHHPPYTKGNHVSSQAMNDDLDAAFQRAGVWPDMVLSAHDHNYQRFTRYLEVGGQSVQIPYVVAGGGGRAQLQRKQTILPPDPMPDVHVKAFGGGNGYILVTASTRTIAVEYCPVPETPANAPEKFVLDLGRRLVQA